MRFSWTVLRSCPSPFPCRRRQSLLMRSCFANTRSLLQLEGSVRQLEQDWGNFLRSDVFWEFICETAERASLPVAGVPLPSVTGVDGVRDGKPPEAWGGFQILGMVREEWLLQALRHCVWLLQAQGVSRSLLQAFGAVVRLPGWVVVFSPMCTALGLVPGMRVHLFLWTPSWLGLVLVRWGHSFGGRLADTVRSRFKVQFLHPCMYELVQFDAGQCHSWLPFFWLEYVETSLLAAPRSVWLGFAVWCSFQFRLASGSWLCQDFL